MNEKLKELFRAKNPIEIAIPKGTTYLVIDGNDKDVDISAVVFDSSGKRIESTESELPAFDNSSFSSIETDKIDSNK